MGNIDKDEIKKLHETELEIMDTIHDFCERNNLKYSLAYGSLIGAVRHKGFIPWDDDLDIFMPREDYEKLREIWLKEGNSAFILQDINIEEEFTQNFIKIRKDNTLFIQPEDEKLNYHKGVFVDIFPLDRKPNNKVESFLQDGVCAVNLLLCRKFTSRSQNKLQTLLENLILKLPNNFKRNLRIYTSKILQKYNNNKNLMFIGTSTIRTIKDELSNVLFDDLLLVPFENRTYYITKHYHNVLTKIYGDYMQLPPEEERVWKHKPIVIKLGDEKI